MYRWDASDFADDLEALAEVARLRGDETAARHCEVRMQSIRDVAD